MTTTKTTYDYNINDGNNNNNNEEFVHTINMMRDSTKMNLSLLSLRRKRVLVPSIGKLLHLLENNEFLSFARVQKVNEKKHYNFEGIKIVFRVFISVFFNNRGIIFEVKCIKHKCAFLIVNKT